MTATSGDSNVAVGRHALKMLTIGFGNIGVGRGSGNNIEDGVDNIVIGYGSSTNSTSSQNEIVIGSGTFGLGNNSVTLGNSQVTDIYMAQDKQAKVHCGNLVIDPATIPQNPDSTALAALAVGTVYSDSGVLKIKLV